MTSIRHHAGNFYFVRHCLPDGKGLETNICVPLPRPVSVRVVRGVLLTSNGHYGSLALIPFGSSRMNGKPVSMMTALTW